jgi:hypothetical protein
VTGLHQNVFRFTSEPQNLLLFFLNGFVGVITFADILRKSEILVVERRKRKITSVVEPIGKSHGSSRGIRLQMSKISLNSRRSSRWSVDRPDDINVDG